MKLRDELVLGKKTKLILTAILAGAAVCLAIFYSLNLVLFLASLLLTYKIVAPMLERSIFGSYFIKGLVSLFVYMVLLQSVILAVWLLDSNFSLNLSIVITLLIVGIMYVAKKPNVKSKEDARNHLPLFQRIDLIAIALTMVITLPIVFQYLNANQQSPSTNFRILASGSDDANHLKMVNARIQYDRGILYKSDAGERLIGSDTYPAGWHSANAMIIKAFDPNVTVGRDSLVDYVFSKMFWVFGLVFIFCRTTIFLTRRFVRKKESIFAAAWLFMALFIFGRIFVANVITAGAYSFIPQLMAVLISVLLLFQIANTKANLEKWRNGFFVLTLVVIGGTLSWVLVLPAFVISVGGILAYSLKRHTVQFFVKNLLKYITYSLPLFLLVLAWIAQLFVMLTSDSPGSLSFFESVSLAGGIMVNQLDFYILVLVGLTAALGFLYINYRRFFVYILWATIPLLIFDICIAYINLTNVGELRYYFYKVLNLLTIILLPLFIMGSTLLITWLRSRGYKKLEIVLFLALFAMSGILFMRSLLHI